MAMTDTPKLPDVIKARIVKRGRGSTRNQPPAGGGAVYGLGMIGALVYFAGTAESPRDYLVAFGKATVWPALLVFGAFKRLEA